MKQVLLSFSPIILLLKFCYINWHFSIEGRIIITGSSCYLIFATSIILLSIWSTSVFPIISNWSVLSRTMSVVLITLLSVINYKILFLPWSPLNVAVIPITLYLFNKRIAEMNLIPFIYGLSLKKSASISSTKTRVSKGMSPVRKSS